ncbi:hypothetical protein VFPBJ_08593 [Purpureocillium lilacinum]|uniref:Uncharacterized protein n=1 Tax=Purpureocillium lilacinum TaxID=33203 RepID=A0A179GFT3_PURLI|nr:hypothetical protein VFPBJ_08593 [Purpureocillium lilacinum]
MRRCAREFLSSSALQQATKTGRGALAMPWLRNRARCGVSRGSIRTRAPPQTPPTCFVSVSPPVAVLSCPAVHCEHRLRPASPLFVFVASSQTFALVSLIAMNCDGQTIPARAFAPRAALRLSGRRMRQSRHPWVRWPSRGPPLPVGEAMHGMASVASCSAARPPASPRAETGLSSTCLVLPWTTSLLFLHSVPDMLGLTISAEAAIRPDPGTVVSTRPPVATFSLVPHSAMPCAAQPRHQRGATADGRNAAPTQPTACPSLHCSRSHRSPLLPTAASTGTHTRRGWRIAAQESDPSCGPPEAQSLACIASRRWCRSRSPRPIRKPRVLMGPVPPLHRRLICVVQSLSATVLRRQPSSAARNTPRPWSVDLGPSGPALGSEEMIGSATEVPTTRSGQSCNLGHCSSQLLCPAENAHGDPTCDRLLPID